MLSFSFITSTLLMTEVLGGALRASVEPVKFTDSKCPIYINGTWFGLCPVFINQQTHKYRCFRAQADNNLNHGNYPVYHNFFIPLCPGYEAASPCDHNFKALPPGFSILPTLPEVTSENYIHEVAAEGDLIEYKYYATSDTRLTLAQLDTDSYLYTHYVHGLYPGAIEWQNYTAGGWSLDKENKRIRLDYKESHFADTKDAPSTPGGDDDLYHQKLPINSTKEGILYEAHKKENYFSTIYIECGDVSPDEPVYKYLQFIHNYTTPAGEYFYDGFLNYPTNHWDPTLLIDNGNTDFLPLNVYDDISGYVAPHPELFYSIGRIIVNDALVCDQLAAI